MGRRTIVAVILGLAACVGDQPTEPIYEGGSFLAALAPPPAPPTVLTAELAAAEGGPIGVDLGDYESPVYAKVTVSGLLGYQGAGGYLPGTGQIDASGVVIQNQCDLIVVVRAATGIIGGANTCPSQPRQIDSYVKYSMVNGHVDAYRTAGPPGSCWKYPAPCIHFTGSQSITVEPQEGNIVLTPSKTSVAAGGGIIITAKGVWASNPATSVPMTVREWRWEGVGPEVGGGHTKVCSQYFPNECVVQVAQSGYVVLEAVVNGQVKTEKLWIRVVGGDSLPPPPPDTLPHEPPGDTGGTGGGGGGGGCGTCCGDTSFTNLSFVSCNPNEDSIFVAVTLSSSEIPPLLTRRYFDANSQIQFSMSTGSQVDVDDARPDVVHVRVLAIRKNTGERVPGVTVRLHSSAVAGSGGLVHTDGMPRPRGSFFLNNEDTQIRGPGPHGSVVDVTTDSAGEAVASYRSSGLGGIEWVVAEVPTGEFTSPPDSARLVLRVPNLVELGVSPVDWYRFKPQIPSVLAMRHGDFNRWIDPEFSVAVVKVFSEFLSSGGVIDDPESGGAFFISDIGLPFGGLNDVGGSDKEWSSPHMSHRTGLDMDVRSVRPDGVNVFVPYDVGLLRLICLGDGDSRSRLVKRCDFEPPPKGNYPHLHIEGRP